MGQTQGFTLIELAVVIAIIAILAAVAVPRMTDLTDQAETTSVTNFRTNLTSAASIYATQTGQIPTSFDDFVSNTPIAAGSTQTISTSTVGNGGCQVAGNTITCQASDFPNLNAKQGIVVQYTIQNGLIMDNVP